MTPEILLTLIILLIAAILFITEWLRVDLVALLVMVSLVFTGLLTPVEALSGFSNPAVVTVWAVFMLSAGLTATGVANLIGKQVLRFAGRGRIRLLIVIMVTAGVLSAIMNNVGVAALLLPVVLTIAHQTGQPPSKLLLPLAIGCLLGGLLTLIGTPPNILASDALVEAGLEPFRFFDFTPVGAIVLTAGILFMVVIGQRLLPDRNPAQALAGGSTQRVDPREVYALDTHLARVEIPAGSPLAGRTLAESRIGRVLGVTVLDLRRNGRQTLPPKPDTILQERDELLVLGNLDRLEQLSRRPLLEIEEPNGFSLQLRSERIGLAELLLASDSPLVGQTVTGAALRRNVGLTLLAIRRNGRVFRAQLQDITLQAGDQLLLQGSHEALQAALPRPDFQGRLTLVAGDEALPPDYALRERLLLVRVPDLSPLAGQSLVESDLADLFGLVVLGIFRAGQMTLAPAPETELEAGDRLFVEGRPEELAILRGLQGLVVKHRQDNGRTQLESDRAGLQEAVLAPHTRLAGMSLRELQFREKYGLSVLAIWRNGRAYRSNLGDMALEFGDAFLVYGPRQKLTLLRSDPDFLVLTAGVPEPPRSAKAPLALVIMTAVIGSVLLGWLPIAIAAVAGAALLVVTGCLQMDEAYRQVEWRAVFLIAGMLPLGLAMEQTGTADFLARGMVNLIGPLGPMALLAGFFLFTNLASQVMPSAVMVVLMAPIALNTAASQGISPYALLMAVAVAASASFMSPVGHPANVLVMGPGGYRFSDYLKVGVPLTAVVLIVTLLVLPLFWPL